MHLVTGGKLYIGQDALEDPQRRLSAVLDDLCICRGALTQDTQRALKTYYKV